MKFRQYVPIPFGGTLGVFWGYWVFWGYFGGTLGVLWGYFEGYFGGTLGYVVENPKFRSPGVVCHQPATAFPLVYLSPLLTVMKEFAIFVLYSLVNILKIDTW